MTINALWKKWMSPGQKYSDMMDFVDNADQYISNALSPFRKHHWTAASVLAFSLWALTMLLCVNGKRLYQSTTGDGDISMPVFRDGVRRCLAGLPVNVRDAHPSAVPPLSNETRSKRRCKSCWYFTREESRTIRICNMCGPIFKNATCPTMA